MQEIDSVNWIHQKMFKKWAQAETENADKHRDSVYADLSVSIRVCSGCEQHYLLLWVFCIYTSVDDWIPGRFWQVGSCWQTDSVSPPLSQHTPTSHHPFLQSGHLFLEEKHKSKWHKNTFTNIGHKCTHVGSDRLAWSKLFTACWAYKVSWEVSWDQRLWIRGRYK